MIGDPNVGNQSAAVTRRREPKDSNGREAV
jgi:hypothetical protein